MVAWICFKEGTEPRMIYAVKPSGGYTKKDFPRFLALLHRRLDGPVTLVWDNYSSGLVTLSGQGEMIFGLSVR
ncbi:hypothetical protein [Streptomyces sp. NBC_01264]|uniref:hypothetical protein n=1 Tax=Streptomyces sp. NBC_01264 TaxID=2903804 RepID=UPI002254D719|nr:hypothetical protein [Streptomyces sp. NBC_01264]MCX4784549.1 hypothetical protein [Streptomyces sp. NBC_01264]